MGLRPYGQPGPLPLMVTLVALLIELEAQILEVGSFDNHYAPDAQTCETVNKSSKSMIAI